MTSTARQHIGASGKVCISASAHRWLGWKRGSRSRRCSSAGPIGTSTTSTPAGRGRPAYGAGPGCRSRSHSDAVEVIDRLQNKRFGVIQEEQMTAGKHRVVVWATGGIGSIAIRTISNRPDLELVGVWVHSEEKVGKDAGELAHGDPIGLAATNDAEELMALEPDCVVYAAAGPERDALAIPDYVMLLEAGCNVVTTSTTRLVNPHAYEPAEWRDQLVAAAKQGQVSLYASGIEPGFAADYLPLVL